MIGIPLDPIQINTSLRKRVIISRKFLSIIIETILGKSIQQ